MVSSGNRSTERLAYSCWRQKVVDENRLCDGEARNPVESNISEPEFGARAYFAEWAARKIALQSGFSAWSKEDTVILLCSERDILDKAN